MISRSIALVLALALLDGRPAALRTARVAPAPLGVLGHSSAPNAVGVARTNALSAVRSGSCTVLHGRDGDGSLDGTGTDELVDRVYPFRRDG